jgi:hypothetical protein
MTHWIVKLGLPLLGALVTGCANMGTGPGSADSSATPLNFSLNRSDAASGTMGTMEPGDQSTGEFF